MFNDLFEDDPFIQEKKAEGRAEGLAEGLAEGKAEGLAEGLQTAVVTVVEGRFPSLKTLAQQKAKQLRTPEELNMLLRQLSRAQDETLTRCLLEDSAA